MYDLIHPLSAAVLVDGGRGALSDNVVVAILHGGRGEAGGAAALADHTAVATLNGGRGACAGGIRAAGGRVAELRLHFDGRGK